MNEYEDLYSAYIVDGSPQRRWLYAIQSGILHAQRKLELYYVTTLPSFTHI